MFLTNCCVIVLPPKDELPPFVTNVKIALVDKEGSIVYSNTTPTRAELGYEAGVNSIKQAIKDFKKEKLLIMQ